MPATTLPMPRRLPADMRLAVSTFTGPVPRYAPGERAPGTELGPRYRAGGTSLARREQAARLRERMQRT